jgi:hypothetical protein
LRLEWGKREFALAFGLGGLSFFSRRHFLTIEQAQPTFNRRTGDLNGSLSGSARFISLLMVTARFFCMNQR